MRTLSRLLCFSVVLCASVLVHGQESKKPLTNADVVKLAQAGIPDDTIVLAIQHSRTKFDTSPDALIVLNKSRVSKRVIDAMLNSSSNPAASSASSTATNDTVAADAPKQHLSDDFAKAGLKALKAIEGTLGKLSLENGSIAVPRQTQELIDNADAEARTDEERAIVAALNKFYIGRLTNNLERELLKPASYNTESELRAQAELENNPRNIEMNFREAACANTIDEMLRARDFTGNPEACAVVSAKSMLTMATIRREQAAQTLSAAKQSKGSHRIITAQGNSKQNLFVIDPGFRDENWRVEFLKSQNYKGLAGDGFIAVVMKDGKDNYWLSRVCSDHFGPLEQFLKNGAEVKESSPALGLSLLVTCDGLQIDKVVPESAAARADIRSGDYLLSLNGQTINTRPELWDLLNREKAAENVTLGVRREGRILPIKVNLAKR